MKKLLIISLLLINGCSSFSLFGDRWRILSPDVMQAYLAAIEAGEEPRAAYYGLTSQGYENLSMTMGEVTRYIEQILHIVGYYKDIDKENEEE